ncbi:MAG: hypothetical protein CMH83_12285 [Nocardioides sp.]|nr:hypothetical protein [Nocardioides sp.]
MSARVVRFVTVVRRLALVAVLVALLLRVGDVDAPEDRKEPDLQVVVALDRTTSMAAFDHPAGSRLAGAVDDLDALAGAMPTGTAFTLLTFDSDIGLALPLTSDLEAFSRSLERVTLQDPFQGSGSSVTRPVAAVSLELASLSEIDRGDVRRVVVLVTDGENTGDEADATVDDVAEEFDALAAQLDAGVVLGYGTEEGAEMPVSPRDPDPAVVLTDPATGDPLRSRIDLDTLGAIADTLDLRLEHRTAPGGMDEVADRLVTDALGEEPPVEAERQVAWLWALLLGALVLVDLRGGWRGWREARRLRGERA